MKTIGILGGMGPGASSALYQKIIQYSQDKYSAVQDVDYPPVILYSLPLVGFDETGIVDESLVKKQLVHGVKVLEKSGADFIVIACNTVHLFIADMRDSVSVPIFSIIELALASAQKVGYQKVGLLSSETTKNFCLYQKVFSRDSVEVIQVDTKQQKRLNRVIEVVMGGKQGEKEVIILKDIIKSLVNQGAEGVVLGCTELPLAIKQKNTRIKIIDTLQGMTEFAVDYARERKLKKDT